MHLRSIKIWSTQIEIYIARAYPIILKNNTWSCQLLPGLAVFCFREVLGAPKCIQLKGNASNFT